MIGAIHTTAALLSNIQWDFDIDMNHLFIFVVCCSYYFISSAERDEGFCISWSVLVGITASSVCFVQTKYPPLCRACFLFRLLQSEARNQYCCSAGSTGIVYINLFNIICCPLFNYTNKMPALCVRSGGGDDYDGQGKHYSS